MPKCFFHDWGKWEEIVMTMRETRYNPTSYYVNNVYHPVGQVTETFDVDGQKRVCHRCGLKQMRKV